VIYSSTSVCMFGLASNPKLAQAKSVDELNRPEITIAYYTGGGEEGWVKERFPKAQLRGVAGSGTAPVEEVMAKRADAVPINRVPWVAMSRKLLTLAVLSGVTSLALGFVVALLRLYGPAWLRPVVVLYIDSMRAIPVLVVLVWTFFALPIVTCLTMPPFVAALIGLTVHLAAYAAEIVRAGVESVRPGQTRAALALGMSRAQIVRRIILPQAIVRMLPAFGSLLSITIKDTAIAAVI